MTAIASGEDRERDAKVTLARWRINPVDMVVNEFKAEPEPEQLVVLERFPTLRRVALAAAKGAGKSCLASWCIWNFFLTRPNANVALTSITAENLRDGLWKELRKWWLRSQFLQASVEFGAERIYPRGANPESWFISARKWSRQADAKEQELTLAGLHEEFAMIWLDEAGGIPDAVANTADAVLASGTDCKVGMSGNTTHVSGPLFRAFRKERDLWDLLLQITGDPNDPKRARRISKQWALDQIQRYGLRSPWVQTNVFANFPTTSTEGVISLDDLLASYGRDLDRVGQPLVRTPRSLGLDVSRRGSNLTVLVYRAGDYVERYEEWQGLRLDESADRAMEACRSWLGGSAAGPPWQGSIYVDDLGCGGGVTDILTREKYPVEAVNACETIDSEFFVNQRSAIAGAMRQRFQDGRISIPKEFADAGFEAEASTLDFKFRPTDGRRMLEDKDSFKVKFGSSPDHWDGFALAFAGELVRPAVGAAGDEVPAERGRLNPFGAGTVDDDEEEGEWGRRRVALRVGAR